MAKGKQSIYFCQNCGYESSKWAGQCPACHEWNSFVEEIVADKKELKVRKEVSDVKALKLKEVTSSNETRISTKINEFDRVLGGGIVPGSLVLVGGDPGIGKSTLLLQTCETLGESGVRVHYISGEESLSQIKLRAERLGVKSENISLLCETNLDVVKAVIERDKPEVVIIDSIQTMYNDAVASAPGSVSQVRESTALFMQLAKNNNISIFVVGHVTKEGTVAGPRVLEHMVDTVLYFEGDRYASYRILRGVKNRFGSTNETGIFEMKSEGLAEVINPSEFMLQERPDAPGSVITCSMEGTRPILVEIQALVSRTPFNFARRTANGVDHNRINMLIAVLEKSLSSDSSAALACFDAYVNITGGMKINEPALDLAIIMAMYSSYSKKKLSDKTICFGEVGLSGEVRNVSSTEQRIKEAANLGYSKVIVSAFAAEEYKNKFKNIEIVGVKNIEEALLQF